MTLIIKCTLGLILLSVIPLKGQMETRELVLEAAREIMTGSKTCALITRDEKNATQVRTMEVFPPDQNFAVWLATNPRTRKVKQLQKHNTVVLYYQDNNENGYVSFHGKATLVNDSKLKEKYWKEEWKQFYPDPAKDLILIKVTPQYLEVISYKKGIKGDAGTWQPSRVDFN